MSKLAVLDSTIQKTHEWLKDIADGLGFPNDKTGFAALRAVLHALRDRLPRQNAVELGAQLPMLIRGMYYEGWDPLKEPSLARHQQEFLDLVARELGAHTELRDAQRVTKIVWACCAIASTPARAKNSCAPCRRSCATWFVAAPPKVREIMSREVTWVGPEVSLQDAARKMRELDIGCLPVGKNDRLIGMVTDRDIACRGVAEGDDPARTPVTAAIMSKGITYCFDDQDVGEAARLMEKKQIHRLPVLNRQKQMIGMLSLGDIGLHASHELTGEVVEAIAQPAA